MDYTFPDPLQIKPSDLFQPRINYWTYESFRDLVECLGQAFTYTDSTTEKC
jgi:hypothetical protein